MINRTALITGAGGYIGSNAVKRFLEEGFDVVAIDNFTAGYKEPLKLLGQRFGKKIRVYERNLQNDLSDIFDKEKEIDVAIHFAASCEVNESMKNPQKYFTNNVIASENLLQTLLRFNIRNIVFSSTCAVYGEAVTMPVNETHPTNPTNPYGLSKRMTEQAIEWYGKLESLNYVILRYFNVFGASDDGELGDSKRPSIHLIQNAVRGALGIEDFFITCPTVNTQDETPIRDYVHVVDLVDAHLEAAEYLLRGGKSEIINLGTGKGNSVLEIVKKVTEITGKPFSFSKSQPRNGEYAKMVASTEKAKLVLGWEAKRGLKEGIQSLVSWYTKHPQGWSE